MKERYGVPVAAPAYPVPPRKTRSWRTHSLYAVVDSAFIVVALILTGWFAGLLLVHAISLTWPTVAYLMLFWALVAYLGLPRLHQLFTAMYVPDYFIARTRTGDGLLGDPVNLAFDGTADDIHAAMTTSGWVRADEITTRSAWGMIVSALARRSYPAAPVSALYLFGRRHEFAYQQEVDGNPAQRHHVRFWPVPDGWVLPGGQRVDWLAAGTYDTSVGLSSFTFQVTHKIDEFIDSERDYIIGTIRYADPANTVRVIDEFSTAYHHRNGGGDRVRTDGDLPIVNVAGAAERWPRPAQPNVNRSHRAWPPSALMFAASLIVLNVVLLLIVWIGLIVASTTGEILMDPELNETLQTALAMTVAFGLQSVLCVLTFIRRRWARLVLLGTFVAGAAVRLAEFSMSGTLGPIGLMSCGTAVLAVLALSASSVREWVTTARPQTA